LDELVYILPPYQDAPAHPVRLELSALQPTTNRVRVNVELLGNLTDRQILLLHLLPPFYNYTK